MSVRILEALAHANPDANFLLADYSKTPLYPIANKSRLQSKDDLEQHIQSLKDKGVQIAKLNETDLNSGVVASFLASSQTDFVVSNDTGIAHLAAALRQERPNTVHTLHWENDVDSSLFWLQGLHLDLDNN
jgi:ADP-heptose:LPS heptosyltransferase